MKNIIKAAFVIGAVAGGYLWSEGALAEPAPGFSVLSAERVGQIRGLQRVVCQATAGMTGDQKAQVLAGANAVFLAAEGDGPVKDEDLGMAHMMSACVLGGDAARNIDRVYARAAR